MKTGFEAVESCGCIVANFWRWSGGNYNGDAFTVGRNDVLLVVVSEKVDSLIVFRLIVRYKTIERDISLTVHVGIYILRSKDV